MVFVAWQYQSASNWNVSSDVIGDSFVAIFHNRRPGSKLFRVHQNRPNNRQKCHKGWSITLHHAKLNPFSPYCSLAWDCFPSLLLVRDKGWKSPTEQKILLTFAVWPEFDFITEKLSSRVSSHVTSCNFCNEHAIHWYE